jgi:hypothetical protein
MPKTATAIAITTGLAILGFEFLLIECASPDDCAHEINRSGGEGSLQGRASLPQWPPLMSRSYRNNSLCRLLHVHQQRTSTMVTETRETGSLIGSDKVEGTAVYGASDTKIGSIERVMIDKMSGRVSYAVLSFGGFLGIGDDHYPLPWQSLKYDTNLGGYRTGITETQLKGAPKYGNDNAWNWSDPDRTRAVNDYYGVAI